MSNVHDDEIRALEAKIESLENQLARLKNQAKLRYCLVYRHPVDGSILNRVEYDTAEEAAIVAQLSDETPALMYWTGTGWEMTHARTGEFVNRAARLLSFPRGDGPYQEWLEKLLDAWIESLKEE